MSSKPGKKIVQWTKDDLLIIAKDLAGVLNFKGWRKEEDIMPQFEHWLPEATYHFMKIYVTYEGLKEHVKRTQFRDVNDNMIVQRGDKVIRENEQGKYYDRIAKMILPRNDREYIEGRSSKKASTKPASHSMSWVCPVCETGFVGTFTAVTPKKKGKK